MSTYKLDTKAMLEFIKYINSERADGMTRVISLTDYVNDKFPSKEDGERLVPELDQITLDEDNLEPGQKHHNLRGVDLSGCIFNDVKFEQCDFTGSLFCDSKVNIEFNDTILKNSDFRGSDLSNCKLGDSYNYEDKLNKFEITQSNQLFNSSTEASADAIADLQSEKHELQQHAKDYLSGMKFGIDVSLLRKDFAKYNKDLQSKKQEVEDLQENLSYWQSAKLLIGASSGSLEYDTAANKLKEIEQKDIFKETRIHNSFKTIIDPPATISLSIIYDEEYKKSSASQKSDTANRVIVTKTPDVVPVTPLDKFDTNVVYSGPPSAKTTPQLPESNHNLLESNPEPTDLSEPGVIIEPHKGEKKIIFIEKQTPDINDNMNSPEENKEGKLEKPTTTVFKTQQIPKSKKLLLVPVIEPKQPLYLGRPLDTKSLATPAKKNIDRRAKLAEEKHINNIRSGTKKREEQRKATELFRFR